MNELCGIKLSRIRIFTMSNYRDYVYGIQIVAYRCAEYAVVGLVLTPITEK